MITFNKFLKALHLLVIRPIKLNIGSMLDPFEIFSEKPDLPAPPDYLGLAEQTSESDLDAARAATQANRYDQYTPLGSMTWTNLGTEQLDEEGYNAALAAYEQSLADYNMQSPGGSGTAWDRQNDWENFGSGYAQPAAPVAPDKADFTTMVDQDKWRSDVNLSPEVQALFDKGMMMKDISADIGLGAGEQIKDIFSTPFELDDFEGYREDVYDAMLDRLETDINKDWQSRNAELYAGGIGRGTEAYGWEQTQRDRMLNDARLQSYVGATDQALRERGQTVKEALLERNKPLNEYNAWRTGSQQQLPRFEAGGQQRTTSGADYLGAGDMQGRYDLAGYSQDVSMYNQEQAAMSQLASDIMGMFSMGGMG